MKQEYNKKIVFWLRLAGWLCLLPASAWLYLFQTSQGETGSYLFLVLLIFIVLFALFVLVTAKSKRWLNQTTVSILAIFALSFVPVVISSPICLAYGNAKKLNQ